MKTKFINFFNRADVAFPLMIVMLVGWMVGMLKFAKIFVVK